MDTGQQDAELHCRFAELERRLAEVEADNHRLRADNQRLKAQVRRLTERLAQYECLFSDHLPMTAKTTIIPDS